METVIDGVRAWISLEKARARLKDKLWLTTNELVILYALYMGYKTVYDISKFRAFVSERKDCAKKCGIELTNLCRFKLASRSDRMAPKRQEAVFFYTITKSGKALINELQDVCDTLYHTDFRSNTALIEHNGQV